MERRTLVITVAVILAIAVVGTLLILRSIAPTITPI
jgi:hypothetical protein